MYVAYERLMVELLNLPNDWPASNLELGLGVLVYLAQLTGCGKLVDSHREFDLEISPAMMIFFDSS